MDCRLSRASAIYKHLVNPKSAPQMSTSLLPSGGPMCNEHCSAAVPAFVLAFEQASMTTALQHC